MSETLKKLNDITAAAKEAYDAAETALEESVERKARDAAWQIYCNANNNEVTAYLKDEQKACDNTRKAMEETPEYKAYKGTYTGKNVLRDNFGEVEYNPLLLAVRATPEWKAYDVALNVFFEKQYEYAGMPAKDRRAKYE